MEGKFYAVIDTNVIVSAVISKSLESNPAKIIRAIVQDRIVPLFNDEILDEYREVLSRPKFHLTQAQIDTVLKAVVIDGLNLDRKRQALPRQAIRCHAGRNGQDDGAVQQSFAIAGPCEQMIVAGVFPL